MNLQCPFCDKDFKTLQGFKDHLQAKHDIENVLTKAFNEWSKNNTWVLKKPLKAQREAFIRFLKEDNKK